MRRIIDIILIGALLGIGFAILTGRVPQVAQMAWRAAMGMARGML